MGTAYASDINGTLESTTDNSVADSLYTFTDLANSITDSNYELNLTSDYKYDEEKDKDLYPPSGDKNIKIDKPIFVINGNNHSIDADFKEGIGIFHLLGNNVTINDLTIKNVLATPIKAKSDLILNNVQFINSGISESKIIDTSSNLTLERCRMENITGPAVIINNAESLTVINSVFLNSKTKTKGFITSFTNKLILENCKFENITSEYGAALHSVAINFANIDNCLFTNLHANITGGAIALKGIPMNEEMKKYNITHETYVVVKNSIFSNVSSEKNGGAIFTDMGSAPFKEGSIGGNVSIINSGFINCKSEFGGAILHLNGNITIINSNFTNNSASVSGGAVYTSYADMIIKDSIFHDNFASRCGGAIYSELNTTSIDNSSFISNKAEKLSEFNPSTIYTYDTSVYIRNSFFNNSKQSISSIFTKKFVEENNIWNNDEFYTNLTIYPIAYNDEGLKLNFTNNNINVSDLPARFDLRDWGWVTPVKNQGDMGACWVFGPVAALESALVKATENTYDLSENNVQNSMLAYSRYGSRLIFEGGLALSTLGYFLSWMGVLPQEDDVYDQRGKISDILDSKNKIHIQDIGFIPIKRDKNRLSYNQTNELIKKAIMEHGAVTMSYAGSDGINTYHNDTYETYHMVAICGWDDNYPKEKFNITPPGNGAWIIKNSGGKDWGDKGYGYVSYYDTSVFAKDNDSMDYTIYFIIENTENYTYNYQSDFTGISNFTNNYTYYSNEFEAIEKADLAAVGTYFNDTGVDYEFKIYVNDVLKLTQNGISEFAGFRTIKLNKMVPIQEYDTFKVVFKSNNVPYQEKSRQHLLEEMSYVSSDANTWIDFSKENRTVCLKAYTLDSKNRIITENLVKIYKNDSAFVAYIGDENKTVTFEINGRNYTRTTDEYGNAKISINLIPGNYTIKTTYNGTTVENNITVLPTLIASNLIKYYKNESQFYISLIDGEGNPVFNVNITMNINGVFYNRTTNTNGTAKLNINLNPGKYTLTAIDSLTGLQMSYTITVLPILSADDLEMFYKGGSQFKAALVDAHGYPLKGAKITFNVNGVFYNRTTDEKGIAKLNINLMAGEYLITSTYENGAAISNKITIRN